MSAFVEQTLDALKARLGAENDAELARKLNVDKSTVSSWRSRDRIPERYLAILNGKSKQTVGTPPLHWAEHEKLAHSLALFKFAKVAADVISTKDYRKHLEFFRDGASGKFWLLMHRSQEEIVGFANETGHDINAAYYIVLHEYVTEQRSLDDVKKLFFSNEWKL